MILWLFSVLLRCFILRGPKAAANSPESQMLNDTFSFRKPNVIIMSLSLLLLEHLVDVVSWQSK